MNLEYFHLDVFNLKNWSRILNTKELVGIVAATAASGCSASETDKFIPCIAAE